MVRVSTLLRWLGSASLAGVVAAVGCKPAPPTPSPTQPATTTAASQPATRPVVRSFGQVVRMAYPDAPTTQPLAQPVSLSEASRIRLTVPLHFDHQGCLWITHEGGVSLDDALAAAEKPDALFEHIVNERVLLAAWFMNGQNNPVPLLVTPESNGKGFVLVSHAAGRRRLGSRDDYRWDRGRVWDDGSTRRLIVPTLHGVSVFTVSLPRGPITEAYQELARPHSNAAPADPQIVFDHRGVLAFVPVDQPDPRGQRSVFRFVNNAWERLPTSNGFAESGVSHLLPFQDGSVAVVLPMAALTTTPATHPSSGNGSGLKLAMATLEAPPADLLDKVLPLATQLVDDDSRIAAARAIDKLGPAAWVVLQTATELDEPIRRAIDKHLAMALKPHFGNLVLRGEGGSVTHRLRDGGALFYLPAGVGLPSGENFAPAWVVARPGMPVQLLSGHLVTDLKPGRTRLELINELWVATTDGFGPRLFLHNAFRRMLRKNERTFVDVLGTDRRGRWLFREPVPPGTLPRADAPTLLIDPTLPDFDGRLPAWDYEAATSFGWDAEGWPAVVVNNRDKLRMGRDGWEPLPADADVATDPTRIPPATRPAASQPATAPSASPGNAVRPATQPTAAPTTEQLARLGKPLLIDADGTHYFGGIDGMTLIGPDGVERQWEMPSEATGFGPPAFMLRAGDGRLYLFNQPGRLLRLKETPGGEQPFVVDKTFTPANTRGLPDEDTPMRVWADPAGRIVFAMDRRIIILFPAGYIPSAIRDLMAGSNDEDGITPVEPNGEVF
jgi:hypothetical protein